MAAKGRKPTEWWKLARAGRVLLRCENGRLSVKVVEVNRRGQARTKSDK